MQTVFITFPELLLFLPLVAVGVLLSVKECFLSTIATVFAVGLLAVSATSLAFTQPSSLSTHNTVEIVWLEAIGNSLTLRIDGLVGLLCVLTQVCVCASVLLTPVQMAQKRLWFVLIFVLCFGLNGVFMTLDLLSFYIFFEIVLIPAYFLAILWGNPSAMGATNKFFLYTFLGSLFMLGALVVVYVQTGVFSTRIDHLREVFSRLPMFSRGLFFACFLFAFAIKMPIFPFHTWQPALYKSAPVGVVILLSAVMVKMGLFGVARWMVPFFDLKDWAMFVNIPIVLSTVGVVYASVCAISQRNLRGLVAYSSIAHIGLMALALFVHRPVAFEGAMVQMFNHGINVLALWVLVDILERKFGTTHYEDLSGLIGKHSALGAFMLIASLANIALPLTNSFVGEFAMFYGIAEYSMLLCAVACTSVILSAVYMLVACCRIVYGTYAVSQEGDRVPFVHYLVLSVLTGIIFFVGIYAKPIFALVKGNVFAW